MKRARCDIGTGATARRVRHCVHARHVTSRILRSPLAVRSPSSLSPSTPSCRGLVASRRSRGDTLGSLAHPASLPSRTARKSDHRETKANVNRIVCARRGRRGEHRPYFSLVSLGFGTGPNISSSTPTHSPLRFLRAVSAVLDIYRFALTSHSTGRVRATRVSAHCAREHLRLDNVDDPSLLRL